MAGTFTNLLYHIIFSTKHRTPMISAPLRAELYPYIGGIMRGEGGKLLEIGGTLDHVHLVAWSRPDRALSDWLRLIKANSSKWANERGLIPDRFAWQEGYGAFSISESQLADVRTYVQNQEEHHHQKSFQEEYLAFLQRHHIEYDERYIWE